MLTPCASLVRSTLVSLLFGLLGLAGPVDAARHATLTLEAIEVGGLRAESVRVELTEGANASDARALRWRIAQLAWPAMALELRDVAWQCERMLRWQNPRCDGSLQVAGRSAGRLAIDLDGLSGALRWSQGRRALALTSGSDAPWRIDAEQLPLAWLGGLLARVSEALHPATGTLSGHLRIDPSTPATRLEGQLRLAGVGFDSPDGMLAGANLTLPLRFDADLGTTEARWKVRGRLVAGELLVSPVYLAVPAEGIGWDVEARIPSTGGWQLTRWAWNDDGALVAEGAAAFGPDGRLRSLTAQGSSPSLDSLATRYLDGVLGPAGLDGLRLAGRSGGRIALDAEGLAGLEIDLAEALAVDPRGRFSLAGLDGGVHWSREARAVESRLGWRAAALYGIGLDSGALRFRSQEGALALVEPLRTGVLGGHLRLDRFVWRPSRGPVPLRIDMGLALEALDLGSLSQRLGWPDFDGSLAGTLPNAVYENNRVRFDGGLAVQLFGGELRVDDLVLERPFGVAPSLAADVRFDDIDLAPLTGAFGFGEITGRLDGRIRDLRLVDWSPVAFDARLLTDRAWQGERRISQRAVQDISDLGGSGLIAGVQARLLRTFDDFGYDRIGIGCVLKDNVCAMTGLKKRGAGFVVVEGRGLPRIEVVGFRREVDWPTLLARLRDATEGDTLRIE